jgi:Protein of unknown function (DUF3179)
MKKIFYTGLGALVLFEILNVYFIMPMPGSQRMNSVDVAYFLFRWRWLFRTLFSVMILYGFLKSSKKRLWIPLVSIIIAAAGVYVLNFKMAADHMFNKTKNLLMVNGSENKVGAQRLIIGVEHNGIAKAYPIQFLGYHHQVSDTIGGEPVIVTYCTVCRTGRVFEPVVNGKTETFRLVGMDHFNAMLEDATTKSWWRQATGEAITGKLKGQKLPEVSSSQTSLGEWLRLYPNSLVMQADPSFASSYDSTLKYEDGKSKSKLTGTDSLSWKDKSWVIGVKAGNSSKAYDWNELKKERIIRDKIDETSIALILANDDKSFFAFETPSQNSAVDFRNDSLFVGNNIYRIDGKSYAGLAALKRLPASQEFWHSWRTFNP